MNNERIKGVITQLSKIPDRKFNMKDWIRGAISRVAGTPHQIANEKNTCGTSACIAGWTTLLYSDNPSSGVDASTEARQLLDLTGAQADQLFFGQQPNGRGRLELSSITRKQAINVMQRLLATGEVRWDLRNEPV